MELKFQQFIQQGLILNFLMSIIKDLLEVKCYRQKILQFILLLSH